MARNPKLISSKKKYYVPNFSLSSLTGHVSVDKDKLFF